MASLGDNQLQRIIRDLHDAVLELSREHAESGEPITDDCPSLHKFFYKLEYLLQFDQKEKSTFLGQRKDYWDYFCDCLIKIKGANDGIRFVKSIPELKTSLGKGRAFIRYSLVHQRLADTLQQCLINQKVTSDWYYARSPFLKSHLTADIINQLYELNQIQFDVAARGYDLDADWPSFARRTLGSGSSAFLWKPPSRCSSITSLVSNYSQVQPQECLPVSDFCPSLLADLGELSEPSSCSVAENLRVELDQSELRQQQLLTLVDELGREASALKDVVKGLEGKLSSAEDQAGLQEATRERLAAAESRNMELMSKLDEAMKEKSQQAANYCDSAWKIQEVLDKLKTAEEERLEAKREADERSGQSERLSQELKLREEELSNCTEELASVRAAAQDERDQALRRLEEVQNAVGRIQGALTVKEKETGNLRAQLQGLQGSLECRERQAEELRRRLQEEREEMEQACGAPNDVLEIHVSELRKSLKNRERELSVSSERVKHLEEQLEKLNVERETSCDQAGDLQEMLKKTVKKREEGLSELLAELASVRASEKHLKLMLESANLCSDDREKRLVEENLQLEEKYQKVLVLKEASEAQIKTTAQDNAQLLELQSSLKKRLDKTQEELDSITARSSVLDRNLAASQRSQAELLAKLQETEAKLGDQTEKRGLLQARVEQLESRTAESHDEKGAAESNEKMQKVQDESREAPLRLVMAEAQLELNLREVNRLRDEVVELRAKLLAGSEEKMKVQALQEVTESSREDLRVLSEQLKSQVEELNRRHVHEILRSREREEALVRERDGEALARAGLAAEVTSTRDELDQLKLRYESLCVESSETREALHRANTETAELGVHVCMLTAEKEEARLRWDHLTLKLEEQEAQELRRSRAQEEQLQEEKTLLEEATLGRTRQLEAEEVLKQELRGAEELQERSRQEVQELRRQLEAANAERQEVMSQLEAQQQRASERENEVKTLQAETQRYCRQIAERNAQMVESESLIRQKDEEIIHLRRNSSRSEDALRASQRACRELSENLRRVAQDQESLDLKAAAELDDLYRTKINLEERLVELIREKDVLWQKSDALEFEQKLRDEENERDVNYCGGCRSQFSWWLRKHSCRLCGRPFCYYCCSNSVSTQQGGHKERCCTNCYSQHSAVVERHPQEEVLSSTPGATIGHLLHFGKGAPEGDKHEDGVFDIITEEEVSGVYDSDSTLFTTASTPGHGQQGSAPLSSSNSAADLTSDAEDSSAPTQDAEIALLKSGEMTLTSHFTADDIAEFGDAPRELFIKSSCYSSVTLAMSRPGPTVGWTFTSEPKSISFSVVYRERRDAPLDQAKVLIPLTRCNSHKETMQGEMKVRNPGEYTLVFDNSFSRFISKKVQYHLTVDQPVVYDGTDQ